MLHPPSHTPFTFSFFNLTSRARPVVNLETELRFVTPVPGKIDLGSADCVTEKGDQVMGDGEVGDGEDSLTQLRVLVDEESSLTSTEVDGGWRRFHYSN